MDEQIKASIIIKSIEILFNQGLPALHKLIEILNNKESITIEDIRNLKGDLDAEKYF